MKTLFDLQTILFQKIKGSSLENAITGGIYKGKRPQNSTLEDIVINAITIDSETLQTGAANVNIYVRDQEVNVDGTIQQLPDSARLSVLADLAIPLLESVYGPNYNFYIAGQGIFDEPEINQHSINLKIRFNCH
ncbi:hypothetical protein [Aquirufa aurantiipilula]